MLTAAESNLASPSDVAGNHARASEQSQQNGGPSFGTWRSYSLASAGPAFSPMQAMPNSGGTSSKHAKQSLPDVPVSAVMQSSQASVVNEMRTAT